MENKVVFITGCSSGIGKALSIEYYARAELSQVNATPAEEFAKKFVAALMLDNPPDILRLGNKSRLLPLMGTLLSTKMLDRILKENSGSPIY